MKISGKKFLGIEVSALFEMIILLLIISLSSYIFGNGDRYINVSPHPFWLVLLMIIIQYNTAEVLACVMMMTLFLYFDNSGLRQHPYRTNDEFYYFILLRAVSWFAIAIFLDLIRKRRIKRTDILKEEIEHNKKIAEKLATSYKEIQKNNRELETKLTGEVNTVLKTFRATRLLGDINASSINLRMAKFVESIINPEKFSFYMLNKNGLTLELEHNWNKDDHYPRKYSSNSALYEQVIAKRHFVCISNEKDIDILKNDGVFAGPIINTSTKEVFGLLKFEEFRFKGLVSKNITMFRIICEWLGFALSNYKQIHLAKSNTLTTFSDTIYSAKFLAIQSKFLLELSKRHNFDVCKIIVSIINFNSLDVPTQNILKEMLSEVIRKHTRTTDMIFELKGDFSSYTILLPGTKLSAADIVLDKIKRHLFDYQNEKIQPQINYSFIITPLNKNQ